MAHKKLDRYEALFSVLEDLAADRKEDVYFLEVGVYNGRRAANLCRYWREQTGGRFNYVGFDLFEDMDPATNTAELSKPVLPPSCDSVAATLKAAGAVAELIRGNTRETLPAFADRVAGAKYVYKPDVIFLDGGHSLDTIASDWAALRQIVQPNTVVLLDDYYENRNDFGCKQLVTGLLGEKNPDGAPVWSVELMNPVDIIESSGLVIRMVKVTPVVGSVYNRAG